jgi:nicotinate-nucleotide pyrophosphorylase (carboxylating)
MNIKKTSGGLCGFSGCSEMHPEGCDLNHISDIVKEALKEDIGKGDITTSSIVPASMKSKAIIIAKEEGVIAGLDIARDVFRELDRNIIFRKKVAEGDFVKKGEIIAEIEGSTRAVLSGERVALNFLQMLSGIATTTRKFVQLSGEVVVLDTRKTTPCLRALEKYAVRVGGGSNHRFNLNEAVLIKDNHIEIAGSVAKAIEMARKTGKKIEVEVKNIKELAEAIEIKADIVLLDNMNVEQIKECVKFVRGRAKVEVSGGVNLNNIKQIAKTGADYVSIGMLTHSPKALDISLYVLK